MSNFDIYCDSGANIPEEVIKKHDIKVIPFTLTVGGKEIVCANYDRPYSEIAKQFYDDMRNGAEVKTSLTSAESIIEALKPSLENGRDVLATFISSGISGSFNQAKEAKAQLEKLYPERKIFVCDSANASMGEGLQTLQAANLRDMGESVATCAEWIENNAYNFNSFLTVGDLKYLRKTGRISTTLAIAGTILNIKPVLKADGGTNAKIVFFDKARGRKKAIAALAEAYAKNAIDPASHVASICHADSEDDALALADMIKALGAKDVIINYYDMCTGSHVGPGTVALFFYGTDRQSEAKPEKGKLFRKTAKQAT